MGAVAAIDQAQRRFPPVAFPLAVVYKFFDDQGNYLAAVATYYAFIAIFPLMLLGSSILGFFLEGRPHLQEELLDSAFAQFPIIGDQLGRPEGLTGSTTAIVVGSLVALYGALGLGLAIQHIVNTAWSVPRNSRPNPILLRVRSLVVLTTAGFALLAISLTSVLITTTDVLGDFGGGVQSLIIALLTILIVGTMLTLLLRVATARQHQLLSAIPGAFSLAVMWQLLQYVGTVYVTRVISGTQGMNQTFALVLGLIGLIYIAAVMGVFGIQINVVLARRLWPRALLTPFTDAIDPTDADRRAYASYALMQRHKGFETITVTFDQRDGETHEIVMNPNWAAKGKPSPAEPETDSDPQSVNPHLPPEPWDRPEHR
ncbi:YihY/virulence factor BrkB family protein [Nocardioides insulae]|uniref:YihY/virulence factor BrkB family protein n=1 Tax=Nocardioides insulae TaxID=394734 RepID=UPI000414B613|nr:YihY/virulence factor BrkB family protein [Nocardioides insulae]